MYRQKRLIFFLIVLVKKKLRLIFIGTMPCGSFTIRRYATLRCGNVLAICDIGYYKAGNDLAPGF